VFTVQVCPSLIKGYIKSMAGWILKEPLFNVDSCVNDVIMTVIMMTVITHNRL